MVLGKKKVKNLPKAGSKSVKRRLKAGYFNILLTAFPTPKFGVLTPKFGRGPRKSLDVPWDSQNFTLNYVQIV